MLSEGRSAAATRVQPGGALRPLSEIPSGQVVRLERRDLAEGEACLLAAMGLTEGCRLVVRSDGDPYIVEARSTRIGLARSVAERLLVRLEDAR